MHNAPHLGRIPQSAFRNPQSAAIRDPQSAIIFSIVIPCRNEAKYIAACLDSILANDFPAEQLEVLVVDGLSDDGTADLVRAYAARYSCVRLRKNPKRHTPAALNLGVRAATGRYITILGSHSRLDPEFIQTSIDSIERHQADCVGGILKTLPAKNTPMARAIALGISHPFGVGNAYFRIGSSEPRYVDTVPFGCYRREVFEKIGLFDEDLARNQDDEFNFRLNRNGGKILLVPDIVSYYYGRDSLLKLWRMYYQYGYFKPLIVRKIGAVLTIRQLIPAIFVGALLMSLLLIPVGTRTFVASASLLSIHLMAGTMFAIIAALRARDLAALLLPLVFVVLHFSYGLGYWRGLIDFVVRRSFASPQTKVVPLTR